MPELRNPGRFSIRGKILSNGADCRLQSGRRVAILILNRRRRVSDPPSSGIHAFPHGRGPNRSIDACKLGLSRPPTTPRLFWSRAHSHPCSRAVHDKQNHCPFIRTFPYCSGNGDCRAGSSIAQRGAVGWPSGKKLQKVREGQGGGRPLPANAARSSRTAPPANCSRPATPGWTANEPAKAVEVWQSVIERYPRSQVRFDAHLRLGNYLLDQGTGLRPGPHPLRSRGRRGEPQRRAAGRRHAEDRRLLLRSPQLRQVLQGHARRDREVSRQPAGQPGLLLHRPGPLPAGPLQPGDRRAGTRRHRPVRRRTEASVEKVEAGKRLFVRSKTPTWPPWSRARPSRSRCETTRGDAKPSSASRSAAMSASCSARS